MNCIGDLLRVIPPENMNDWALINGVIRINHLQGGKAKERVDGDECNADGILVSRAPPLKIVVCA